VLSIVDWFVVTSASNTRLVQTLADEVEAALKADGGGPLRVEGYDDAAWVLLDFGDVVVHVFLDDVRSYYELERLWGDVPRLDWERAPEAAGVARD
jgi:ribosome-associated protein